MTVVAMYRCLKCGKEYRPLEAGARHDLCCGMRLERIPVQSSRWPSFGFLRPNDPSADSGFRNHEAVSSQPPQSAASLVQPPSSVPQSQMAVGLSSKQRQDWPVHDARRASSSNLDTSAIGDRVPGYAIVEIVPPREHRVDEAAAERLFASLGSSRLVSVEMGAEQGRIKFLLRGSEQAVSRAQHQVQAAYDQARFRPVSAEEDPARRDGTPCATAKLHLRKPCYLPLATFRKDDFETADPLRGLLGVFSHLEEGERLLSQLILTPAPRGWADAYSGYLRPSTLNNPGEPLTVRVVGRQAASVTSWLFMVASSCHALMMFLQHQWIALFLDALLVVASCVAVGFFLKMTFDEQNLNPELVQKKIQSVAYDVNLRLTAFAPTLERARELLHELADAYGQFDLASANGLEGRWIDFDPRLLERESTSWWDEFRGRVNRLNVAELAAMWHLPLATDTALVEHTQAKRLLPRPSTVREGVLVGESEHMGRKIPVRLEPEALWHHMFMIAKTQKGKSTLMAHLAAQVMQQPERASLVVVDPHGDLARSLLGLVPLERVSDVVYVDFSDTQRVVGLNLLDMSQGRNADAIVSNIVHVGELIWRDYWGPRMEDALRMALRTLLAANEKLVQLGRPQFTLIDIPALYELANFRHRLLKAFVTDPEVVQWWGGYFERLYESLRMDVINPVLTKVHRFSTHSVVRNVIGQSRSTVNFRELLNDRKILIVNTATGVVGPDAGGLLGAVIVDSINFAVREQMRIPDPKARARVVVIMDEFQSIPGVDYPGLLAELQKMGASFILATQSLGQLDAIDPELRRTIIANAATLFVFQASAEDADLLRHELDDAVTATDIINLPDYACYIKSQKEHERLPVMYNQTPVPSTGNPMSIERIVELMPRYSGSGSRAETARQEFKQEWYGRELDLLLDIIGKGGRRPRSRGEHQDATKDLAREQGTSTSSENPAPSAPHSASSPAPAASSSRSNDQVVPKKAKPPQGKEPQGPTRDAREVASIERQAQPDEDAVAGEVERLEEELRRLEEERRRDESSPEGGLAGEDPILDT